MIPWWVVECLPLVPPQVARMDETYLDNPELVAPKQETTGLVRRAQVSI